MGIFLDEGNQFDAVHAWHVDVGDHQIEVPGAHGVPSVHPIYGDFYFISMIAEQLTFKFADGKRIVYYKNSLAVFLATCSLAALDRPEPSRRNKFFDRANHVLDVDN